MSTKSAWGPGSRSGRAARMTYAAPTYEFLERRARRRAPKFAFDFVQGGTGADWGVAQNRRAFDAVEIIPRYGQGKRAVDPGVRLFDRAYASPIGVAPVGMDALIWPGATMALARAAKRADIPYITGTLANSTLEEVAAEAGPNAWLQLYGFPRDDHRVTFDMIDRARAAGLGAIVATLDAPVRAKRPRDLFNRLVVPFRTRPRTVWEVATSPWWALELLRAGMPKFANIERYVDGRPTLDRVAGFVQKELVGTFDWAEIARMRRAWDGPLIVKGVMHPDDADSAINAGADGIIVSNHGGRQSDGAPASIDALPTIADRVGDRATLLLDSGVRSGLDAARAIALGAQAVFCGRGYLYALAALGRDGGAHFADLIKEEFAVALAQSGAADVSELAQATIRRPGADPFAP